MIGLVLTLLLGKGFTQVEKVAFSLGGQGYVHRYSKAGLHEFTPKGQADLKTWTDMVTINDYAKVQTGEALAKSANSVLDTYKEHKAVVVRTDSVPRTTRKEAEHLIVVMFSTTDFVETAFARFLIVEGQGHSIVYSHRTYGKSGGESMSKWIVKQGQPSEKALMMLPLPKH